MKDIWPVQNSRLIFFNKSCTVPVCPLRKQVSQVELCSLVRLCDITFRLVNLYARNVNSFLDVFQYSKHPV